MKFNLCFLFIFYSSLAFTNVPVIKDVRIMLHNATSNEQDCTKMISLLSPFNEINNPLFLGYRGGATMLMAKHVINPFSKLSYFKKGKLMLENAIKADYTNVELRFLRYTIRTFIAQSLPKLKDQDLKKIISEFLLKHSK